MSAIILDGSMVHYEALGRGRPIVFLHGWVGSWRYWINAMQVASTSFRAYALDLFGFGDTTRDPLRYSLDQQAGLVNRFLEEMGIGKVALVGHDLGALVGLSFIKEWPRSVDRMMMINCPLEYDSLNARMRTAPATELVDWLASRTPEAIAALSDASKVDPRAVSISMAGLQANNLFASISTLGIPGLFVYGTNNPAVTLPSQEKANALPLHMHQIILEGAGHFPMIDNPTQFNRLLTDFLALDSGASPRELQMKEEWKRRVR
ncbi:MAG: alpha/beta hydrolase [Anaerolineales bacterium]|nr:MAG: alpha/beta hydrolase [Anaerolineales bacterium]